MDPVKLAQTLGILVGCVAGAVLICVLIKYVLVLIPVAALIWAGVRIYQAL